jgi:hypothetical protein
VLTAKLLTQLSNAGFLSGQPGPGGGYTLIKPATQIRLIDIVRLFEQIDETSPCPFGTQWCGGEGDPCPLHDIIFNMTELNRRFLEQTTLEIFQKSGPPIPASQWLSPDSFSKAAARRPAAKASAKPAAKPAAKKAAKKTAKPAVKPAAKKVAKPAAAKLSKVTKLPVRRAEVPAKRRRA